MDEPTAWEDINPGTALARRPAQLATCSDRLRPATNIEFRNELTACLILVVPAGMTEEARGEWLRIAWATVGHLPADLLAIGCEKARETADHPSKIVPIIIAETTERMERRRAAAPTPARPIVPAERRIEKQEAPLTPDQIIEMNHIMKRFGIKTRYRDDGSTFQLGPDDADPVRPSH
jgi:hypothetical protein